MKMGMFCFAMANMFVAVHAPVIIGLVLCIGWTIAVVYFFSKFKD
jgi:hypothetical protein